MRFVYAFLANAAEVSPDGKLYVLGGDIDTIQATDLPARHPLLAVVMRFIVPPEDFNKEQQLQVRLVGPDKDQVGSRLDLPFTPIPSPTAKERNRETGIPVVIYMVHTEYPKAGEYAINIGLNGEEVGSLPLHVVVLKA